MKSTLLTDNNRGAKSEMRIHGFCKLLGSHFDLTPIQKRELSKIKKYFNFLPKDEYCKSSNRFRQMRKFTLLPYASLLIVRPENAREYHQNENFNLEAAGIQRKFEPIPDSIASLRFLQELIWFDFLSSPMGQQFLNSPIDVGVHFIRLAARLGHPGKSTPNCLHKDGEPFTWIHLVDRVQVTGGENVVADNKKRLLQRTTLDQPLDSIGIVDEKVFHQVTPVFVENGMQEGFRDVILIDFTRLVPHIPHPITN